MGMHRVTNSLLSYSNFLTRPLIRGLQVGSLVLIGSSLTSLCFAETTDCIEITSVPIAISQQGVYCFKKHIATSISTGPAIEIQTNNVVIDFNGFKLGGLAAGVSTGARGVDAVGRLNITLRNGNIRGFLYGISLVGANSGGHVIEDTLLDGNTHAGIIIDGEGNVVRNNRIIATGGTTLDNSAYGIYSTGAGMNILGNEIYGTFAQSTGDSYGVFITSPGDSSVVQGNIIKETLRDSGNAVGIFAETNNVLIDGNAIINSQGTGDDGIRDTTGGYCVSNTILGYTTENNGCTDGGGNSFSP